MKFAPFADRLARVREEVAAACGRVGRDPASVQILAITKGHPVDVLTGAAEAGFDIGENRVGEAAEKLEIARDVLESLDRPVRLHMVGHLQRNKVRDAVALFDWIQSVDSIRLAREIDKRAKGRGSSMPVLIQVDAAGEEQKHGFVPEEAAERAAEIAERTSLEVRGTMTMAPWTDDERVLREAFRTARRIHEEIRSRVEGADTLSMGMSNDYEIAVEEGATMVRLGTALFGPRNP